LLRRRLKRWPPYWEEYEQLRKNLLDQQYPKWSEGQLESVVRATRGKLFDDLDDPQTITSTIWSRWNTPPRHPIQGNYAEREINPLVLRQQLEDIGFFAEIVSTNFAVVSPISKIGRFLLKAIHPLSLLISPGFTILAEKTS
jgi:hypothetical protein